MAVEELKPGLWWWEAVHPEWTEAYAETEDWGPEVSSYALDDGARLLLFDPTALPEPVAAVAAGRDTVIVLTCPWHERNAREIAAELGAQANRDGQGRFLDPYRLARVLCLAGASSAGVHRVASTPGRLPTARPSSRTNRSGARRRRCLPERRFCQSGRECR